MAAPVIIILLLVAAGWAFLAVPWRRRQRSHMAMQDAIVPGDEIITAGGMHAVVREAGEQELRIEIAPGVVVTLDRRAVAAVAQEIDVDDDPDGDGVSGEQPGDDLAPVPQGDEEIPNTG